MTAHLIIFSSYSRKYYIIYITESDIRILMVGPWPHLARATFLKVGSGPYLAHATLHHWPSILSIIPSFLLVFKIGSVSMVCLLMGSHLISHFALRQSQSMIPSLHSSAPFTGRKGNHKFHIIAKRELR